MPQTPNLRRSALTGFLMMIFLSTCVLSHAQFSMTETFANNSIGPNLIIGNNAALTAASGIDPAGQGWLRLTNSIGQSGYCYINQNIPSGLGVLAEFEFKAWSTSSDPNADGFSMFLFDANYGPGTFSIGALGGALGYIGLPGAYIGIGLDEFGNNSNPYVGGDGNAPGFRPQAITVRAPASQNNVYLTGTGVYLGGTPLSGTALSYGYSPSRPPDEMYYRKARITVAPVGGLYQITVALQTSPSGTMTNVLTTTTATPPPANLKIGFAASTGSYWANHEIRNLMVTTPGGVRAEKTGPQLFRNGDNVSYKVKVYNDGLTPQSGIAFTDSLPAGFQFGSIAFDNTGDAANTFDISAGSVANNVYTNNSLGLDVGSYGIFTINGTMALTDSTTKQMRNTAIAKAPGSVVDPDLINDTSRFTSYRVPVINKKDIALCGGNDVALALTTMAGAQLNWTVSTTGSITGAVAGSGAADASGNFTLHQTVTNTGSTPGTVTYTVTPSYLHTLLDGSTLTANGTPVISTVTVNPVGTAADITLPDAAVCYGNSIKLTAGSATVTSPIFKWYADAALTQLLYTGAAFTTPALTANASYFVTIENGTTCQSIPGNAKQVNVTVNANPAPPALSANVYVCQGTALTLSTTTFTGYSYNWTWGAGKSATGSTITVASQAAPADATTYTLTATEVVTGCFASNTTAVTVKSLPAVPTISWTAVCEGSDQLLTASSSTPGVTYTWTGVKPLTVNNDQATIKAATVGANGIYSVSTTLNGCTSQSATANVQIKVMPAAPAAGYNNNLCQGSNLLLFAATSTSGTIVYNWSGPNGFSSNLPSPSITKADLSATGHYLVSATLNGCTSTATGLDVVINKNPSISINKKDVTCLGGSDGSINLTPADGLAPYAYKWNNGNSNQNLANLKAGNYNVLVTDANGCKSNTTYVVVNDGVAPPPAPVANNLEACEGTGSVTLSAQGTNLQWYGLDGSALVNAPHISKGTPDSYSYYVSSKDALGCESGKTMVTALIKPTPEITAINKKEPNCNGIAKGYFDVSVAGGCKNNGYTFTLLNSTLTQSNGTFTNVAPGSYTVQVSDACGCSVTQNVDMTVKMIDCDLQLPNAFTPNNDNKNDIFRPASWGVVTDYKLQVYNRQGQLVFQSTRPEDGWNGSIRGMVQPEGTYIWLLTYKNGSGELRNLKGTVLLLQ